VASRLLGIGLVTQGATEPGVRYPAVMEPRYTNYFQIGHNSCEIVIDCGCFYETDAAANIHTRVATTPRYAKALMETLERALHEYEAAYGVIAVTNCDEASEDRGA